MFSGIGILTEVGTQPYHVVSIAYNEYARVIKYMQVL